MANIDQADIFLIPLLNGDYCVGQVIDPNATPSAALCLISQTSQSRDAPASAIDLVHAQSVLLITAASLNDGNWAIIGFEQLPNVTEVFDWRYEKIDTYQRYETYDPAVIEAFVNATFGLYPWDSFGEGFFEKLLLNPDKRPEKAVLKSGKPAK